MATYSSDRRSALKILGAIGATCAYPYAGDELFAQSGEHQHVVTPHDALRFFSDTDFRTISRIADLIIPETKTPAASGAGVPAYIDMVIGQNIEQQQLVADGLRWLDEEAGRQAGKKFMDLPETAQLRKTFRGASALPWSRRLCCAPAALAELRHLPRRSAISNMIPSRKT